EDALTTPPPPPPAANRNTPRPPIPSSPPTPSPTQLLTRRSSLPLPLHTAPSPITPQSVNSGGATEATLAPMPTVVHSEEGEGEATDNLDRPFTPPRRVTRATLSPEIAIVSSLPPTPSFELAWHESGEVDDSAPELEWEEGRAAELFTTPARDGLREMGWGDLRDEVEEAERQRAAGRMGGEPAGEEGGQDGEAAARCEKKITRFRARKSLGGELERAEAKERAREEGGQQQNRERWRAEATAVADLVAVTYNLRKSTSSSSKNRLPTSPPSTSRRDGLFSPPPVHDGDEGEPTYPRAATLISPRFPPAAIAQLPIASRDVVGVDLHTSEAESVRVINVYNPSLSSPTPNRTVATVLPPLLRDASPNTPLVVAGNFNLQHGEWDPLLLDAPSEEVENL
ncbi:hypothetical protein JCM6882_003208, partial [Rhodosporidiobolus microsporus]